MRNFVLRPVPEHFEDGLFYVLDNPYNGHPFGQLIVTKSNATLVWESNVYLADLEDVVNQQITPLINSLSQMHRRRPYRRRIGFSGTAYTVSRLGKIEMYPYTYDDYTRGRSTGSRILVDDNVVFARFDVGGDEISEFADKLFSVSFEEMESDNTRGTQYEMALQLIRGFEWSPQLIDLIINLHTAKDNMQGRINLVEASSLISTLTGPQMHLLPVEN